MRCPPVSPILFEARLRSDKEVLEGRKVDNIMAPFSPILFHDRSSTSTWQLAEVRKLQMSVFYIRREKNNFRDDNMKIANKVTIIIAKEQKSTDEMYKSTY